MKGLDADSVLIHHPRHIGEYMELIDAEERKTRLQRVYGDDWENHWTNRNEVSETALDNSDFNWDFVLKNPTYSDLEQFILELYRLENLPKA